MRRIEAQTSTRLTAATRRPADELSVAIADCIPNRYHPRMTTQIAVRLPDDIVEFIDQLVDAGQASSRASVVARAVDRERRRRVAERDAAILAQAGADPDLDRLAEYAARTPLDDLD